MGGLEQDCSVSICNVLEILWSCTEPSNDYVNVIRLFGSNILNFFSSTFFLFQMECYVTTSQNLASFSPRELEILVTMWPVPSYCNKIFYCYLITLNNIHQSWQCAMTARETCHIHTWWNDFIHNYVNTKLQNYLNILRFHWPLGYVVAIQNKSNSLCRKISWPLTFKLT